MSLTLYQIKNEYLNALNELTQCEDLTPQIIEDSLVVLKGELQEKSLNVGAYIKNLEAKTTAMAEYEKRMYDRRKQLENQVNRLKEYLKTNMEICGITEISGDEFNLTIRKNPPHVVVDNEKEIEPMFFKREVVVKLDKTGIKDAIKNNEIVKGVHLEQSTSLVIK